MMRDDAIRTDQGVQTCSCGDITVITYQGRVCCERCLPERQRAYRALLTAPAWQTDATTREARGR